MSVATGRAAAVRRARPVTVDVRAALNLVGTLTKYLGFAALVPAGVALWYGEPRLALPRHDRASCPATAWAVERATAAHGTIGAREGFLVVALTWLAAAVFGALPYLLYGDPQLDRPMDAYFEAMSGFTTTGASVLTDSGPSRRRCSSGASSPSGSAGWGSSCSRSPFCPACASAAASCSSRSFPARAGAARLTDQPDRPAAVVPVHGDHVRAGGRARLLSGGRESTIG